ncbi:MAG: YebC/PmpR family DNA-binding transcriptional regulator [Candidatus Levybacteria bacterium]|nr:YebC/PmpR family DNA-binding transcriptional regulator [Candidatus Levybacteria bacterium]
MSGHSKWATIKRAKGAADLKRGLTFTKISNAITIAVKTSGGITDPNSNFKLRLAVDAAKANNMPKDNIERALRRAQGKLAGEVEEVIYEGFAPAGVAIIIEAATDNSLRTTSEIKSIFNKDGGNFGQPGSVAYLFEQKGEIILSKDGKTIDEAFEAAVESGAEDVAEDEEGFVVYTKPSDLAKVSGILKEEGFSITSASLIRKPLTPMPVDDPGKKEKVISFLQKLEDLDDVQKVYSNLA